jgi:hypothetical protein
LRIGGTKLHQIFQDAECPLDLHSGRFPLKEPDAIPELATEFLEMSDISCGYRRIAESIAQEGRPPPLSRRLPIQTPKSCATDRPYKRALKHLCGENSRLCVAYRFTCNNVDTSRRS